MKMKKREGINNTLKNMQKLKNVCQRIKFVSPLKKVYRTVQKKKTKKT